MNINIPKNLIKKRDIKITPDFLINFEKRVKLEYEAGKIKAPIHLSKNNENELIEIFQYIDKGDWVFVAWRNHYHALLHGIDPDKLFNSIVSGKSMGTNSIDPNFYTSSIVGGIIPLAVGVAMALQKKKSRKKVWCFVGDMTFETGGFHECYKYAKNFNFPIRWIVEDNNISVNTQTELAWGGKQTVPDDVIYYRYTLGYPHHGTGTWVDF